MSAPARRIGRQASPQRSIVWREPPPKAHKQPRRPPVTVPVVYYLCRSRQLDHPHFIQVPLSSPAGLTLRDVVDRLGALRGKTMPAMYSWSCKRSYKNGYVWQDLAEDDPVTPANGDYILKGTELMDHSLSDSGGLQKDSSLKLQSPDHPHPHRASPIFSNTQEANSSSSSPVFVVKEARFLLSPQEDNLSSCRQGMVEKWVQKPNERTNASTQTEDGGRVASGPDTRKKSVWTEDGGRVASGPDTRKKSVWTEDGGRVASGPDTRKKSVWTDDGGRVASGPDTRNKSVWTEDGGRVASGPDTRKKSVWTEDGGRVASGPDTRNQSVWTEDGGRVAPGPDTRKKSVWTEDGGRVASGPDTRNKSVWTEDEGRVASGPDTRNKSVWTEDEPSGSKFDEGLANRSLRFNGGEDNGKGEISPPPVSSSANSPCGRMDTLEALIKAESRRMNGYRLFDNDGEVFVPMKSKQKATNMLLQVITCGSMSMKGHHSFRITPTSKQKFSHVIPSSVFTTSVILQEFDLLSENPRVTRLRQEEKKHHSGRRTVEANKQKEEEEEGTASLNRSSYYYEDRSIESPNSIRNEQKVVDSTDSKCLPRKTKVASCKQSWKGTFSSPNTDARNKPVKLEGRPLSSSNGGSRRITDSFSIKGSSMRLESFKQEEMIKIMGN